MVGGGGHRCQLLKGKRRKREQHERVTADQQRDAAVVWRRERGHRCQLLKGKSRAMWTAQARRMQPRLQRPAACHRSGAARSSPPVGRELVALAAVNRCDARPRLLADALHLDDLAGAAGRGSLSTRRRRYDDLALRAATGQQRVRDARAGATGERGARGAAGYLPQAAARQGRA